MLINATIKSIQVRKAIILCRPFCPNIQNSTIAENDKSAPKATIMLPGETDHHSLMKFFLFATNVPPMRQPVNRVVWPDTAFVKSSRGRLPYNTKVICNRLHRSQLAPFPTPALTFLVTDYYWFSASLMALFQKPDSVGVDKPGIAPTVTGFTC